MQYLHYMVKIIINRGGTAEGGVCEGKITSIGEEHGDGAVLQPQNIFNIYKLKWRVLMHAW